MISNLNSLSQLKKINQKEFSDEEIKQNFIRYDLSVFIRLLKELWVKELCEGPM